MARLLDLSPSLVERRRDAEEERKLYPVGQRVEVDRYWWPPGNRFGTVLESEIRNDPLSRNYTAVNVMVRVKFPRRIEIPNRSWDMMTHSSVCMLEAIGFKGETDAWLNSVHLRPAVKRTRRRRAKT